MYNFWIIVLCLGLLATKPINGQSELDVQLVVPRYVERGSSATMKCKHNVRPEILYKVTWLKVDKGKFFEFINGRNPPFRNTSIGGGEIDWENSNETQVTLKNVDFELSGQFFCEVSTDAPIYTEASVDELLSVFLPQTGPPIIKFRKRMPFVIGEKLFALCNTTRAFPAPHITWLINGKKVEDKYVRTHHAYSMTNKGHRRTQQQQQIQQQLLQQKYYQQQYYNQHQQQEYHVPYLIDRYDKSLRRSGGRPDDFTSHSSYHHDGHHHSANIYNNPFSSLANMHEVYDNHEIHQRNYDNKPRESKKHRNSSKQKYRRHINENALGIIRSTLNSGGFGPQPPNLNNELGIPANAGPMSQLAAGYGRPISHAGGGMGVAAAAAAVAAATKERGMFSLSQLNIDLEEAHNNNGRMELTCLSTIPSAIGQGEQFADYKTYSVKVELMRAETSSTTTTAPSIGMAALGNGASHAAETAAAGRPTMSLTFGTRYTWVTVATLVAVLQMLCY
ncbi:uncharacterized protein LOC105222632 [Bactrocera dorsalis]|uniref:Uncharacterized protein LOC105222632 n=1 Tax=Bactrocera dorsalis TaxID=27457 RepID=A0ABM3J1C7_BACDO|nr:uncharacterized protein LOC105222632 [Bactrocera dorsalis]